MSDSQATFTEFDDLVSESQLLMMKAAIPYVSGDEQRMLSLFVKLRELMNTIQLLQAPSEEGLSICSVEEEQSTPLHMLEAIKPYGKENEQSFIDVLINFLQASNLYKDYSHTASEAQKKVPFAFSPLDLIRDLLAPEQKAQLDRYQMLFQTLGLNM